MGITETRDELIALLQAGEVTINFQKMDETEREFVATLKEGVMPALTSAQDSYAEKKKSSDQIVVWVPASLGWRTVKLDRINSISA
jgi:SH3-like domain-containing protein